MLANGSRGPAVLKSARPSSSGHAGASQPLDCAAGTSNGEGPDVCFPAIKGDLEGVLAVLPAVLAGAGGKLGQLPKLWRWLLADLWGRVICREPLRLLSGLLFEAWARAAGASVRASKKTTGGKNTPVPFAAPVQAVAAGWNREGWCGRPGSRTRAWCERGAAAGCSRAAPNCHSMP